MADNPSRPPSPPRDLGTAGRALWRRVLADYDLDAVELAALTQAARTVDELQRIHDSLAQAPSVTVAGSTGQPRAHPLLAEARAHRATLTALLASIDLPTDVAPTAAQAATSAAASKAARVRWDLARTRDQQTRRTGA